MRYEKEALIVERAEAAGHKAAMECVPDHMIVVDERTGQRWDVADGPCGFAWIAVKPGNCRMANYLKAEGKGRKDDYYGGVRIWVGAYGQSMTRKEAYAQAYAHVLREAGVKAYANARID